MRRAALTFRFSIEVENHSPTRGRTGGKGERAPRVSSDNIKARDGANANRVKAAEELGQYHQAEATVGRPPETTTPPTEVGPASTDKAATKWIAGLGFVGLSETMRAIGKWLASVLGF